MSEVLPFISERKLKEELRNYLHMRFENHMLRADRGEVTRELAVRAFFLEYQEFMETEGGDDAA